MKSDAEIARDVTEELRWTPDVDAKDVAVKVTDGVVALTGFVKSFQERGSAERAAKRVGGVRALANDLEVRLPEGAGRSDPDIARSAADALEHELPFSAPLIRITVHDGRVTLEGVVDWEYQRERAAASVANLRGVRHVTNLICLKGRPVVADIKHQIAAAFKRSAQIDSDQVGVEINGSEITLTGKVRSWAEHEAAADIAWSAPGVTQVKNQISVGP